MRPRWWLAPPVLALAALLAGAAPAAGLLAALDAAPTPAQDGTTEAPAAPAAPTASSHAPDLPAPARGTLEVLASGLRAGTDAYRAAEAAHWEHAGLVPQGFARARTLAHEGQTDGLAFDWVRATPDLDGDGIGDAAVHRFDLLQGTSTIMARSGADGRALWQFENGFLVPYNRAGLPIAEGHDPPTPVLDANGDRVADLIVYSYDATRVFPPIDPPLVYPAEAVAVDAAIHALDGRTGATLWTHPLAGVVAWEALDPSVAAWVDVPTGWLAFDAPDGPRILVKTTDLTVTYLTDPACPTGLLPCLWVRDVQVAEHLTLLDASGAAAWTRDLLPTDDPEFFRLSWITGVADLTGDGAPDVVLEQHAERRPQFSEWPFADPLTGDPTLRYGRAMHVRTLDGRDGADLWDATVFKEPVVRPNIATEEPFPILVWIQAQVLDDVTGDGTADPLAKYLVVDSTSPGTVNGMFRTHFVPLDGRDGTPLFNARYQGWGYAATVSAPGDRSALLAIGTVDLPTDPPPQGGYPPKDVHLAVLDVANGGVPTWSTSRRFAQDSTLVFDLTLRQYMHALAPHDWDGDGVRDVLSPAQYVRPQGANQTLLATSSHRYEIFSGATGEVLHALTAWGPLGLALECDAVPGLLTFVSGHARRIDATRYDPATGATLWRQPLVFDERPRPATAGIDVLVFSPTCDDAHGVHLMSVNLDTLAIGHLDGGHETPRAVAALTHPGDLLWMDPELARDVPLVATILRAPPPETAWYLTTHALIIPAAALPSAGAGILLSRVARRRQGGTS